jgi:mannonate dehydratase
MKLGLGLYRHLLTRDNFQFARQAGATHIVAHLVDYFQGGAHNPRDDQPTGAEQGWGRAGDPKRLWPLQELVALRQEINAAGLELEAIENFDPAHWHDILLDGPGKKQQLENVKTIIRRLGQAGIPIMGCNFSIAGVCGRTHAPYARGGAKSVGMEGPLDTPMPKGMVWNMVYDGDVDMLRVLRILKKNNYEGVLIPDHTPQMTCGAPWHAGMAFALGYMRAALQAIGQE